MPEMPSRIRRTMVWQGQVAEEPSIEYLTLYGGQERVEADGYIIGVERDMPFRLHYDMTLDGAYGFQSVDLFLSRFDRPPVYYRLVRDDDDTWVDGTSTPLPALAGCTDIDITATPFTNTLPIRRLALEPGQSAEIMVAYVIIPDLRVSPERQRYSCLHTADTGATYRFQSLATGFTADIEVDAEGLVVEYPGLFRRVWSQV